MSVTARPGDVVREIVSLSRGEPILTRLNLSHLQRVRDAQDAMREYAAYAEGAAA